MIRKTSFIALLSALLLSGCGGGGSTDSNQNSMNDKKYIIILRDIRSGICESSEYRTELSSAMGGLLTKETATDTSCSSYGKVNDGVECQEEIVPYEISGDKNCVIGFNTTNRDGRSARVTENAQLSDLAEILSDKLY